MTRVVEAPDHDPLRAVEHALASVPADARHNVQDAVHAAVAEYRSQIATALALATSGRLLLDAREVATALGVPPVCECPGGPDAARDALYANCGQHSPRRPDAALIAALLPSVVEAAGRPDAALGYSQAAGRDVAVICALFERLTDPGESPL